MIASQLMIAFGGRELPREVAEAIASRPFAGVTLFRAHNVESAAQVRALTAALQAAAAAGAAAGASLASGASGGPLLIATDQEGGQLVGLGDDTTQFAGAMALGAAGDEDLAERVARATAVEMRALGLNVNYAPMCDLATNPANPSLGIRSIGDDPTAVGALAAATVRGLQAEGVAATLKHFPGHGDIGVDTHLDLAVVERSRQELIERELVPFRAGLAAGARLVMAGHFALPALTGDATLPASLAREVITDLLREQLGFEGLAITDALDMHALAQGAAQIVDAICALRAGEDLLLGTADAEQIQRLEEGLAQAERRGLTDPRRRERSAARLAALRGWLAGFEQPSLDVVGSAEHRVLASELARRSITLVRNDDRLLPLRLPADARVAVVQPEPTDLTPADTSSYVPPLLTHAVQRRHAVTDEFIVDIAPSESDIASLVAGLAGYDLVILGTVAANLNPSQATLAQQLVALGRPTVTVALRTPWDIGSYPSSRTHVCSFGILAPTIEALTAALFGEIPFGGRLPVEIGGLHPRGHGLDA
jgi:beta-N-acetylhexosaminidase